MTARIPFCVYVELALDRIDIAGAMTPATLRAEADALRQAASVLEGRARSGDRDTNITVLDTLAALDTPERPVL